jgi:hypothetical protein
MGRRPHKATRVRFLAEAQREVRHLLATAPLVVDKEGGRQAAPPPLRLDLGRRD